MKSIILAAMNKPNRLTITSETKLKPGQCEIAAFLHGSAEDH
jgi:hypothetical protein